MLTLIVTSNEIDREPFPRALASVPASARKCYSQVLKRSISVMAITEISKNKLRSLRALAVFLSRCVHCRCSWEHSEVARNHFSPLSRNSFWSTFVLKIIRPNLKGGVPPLRIWSNLFSSILGSFPTKEIGLNFST
jgi:hypothetical protein